ncbi:MAG: AAA family ATPase, partial [Candidatus Omnitrophica bacterium]|nr:AAA family ATPase [Candidatus Omnitrophota bacterium]
MYLTKVEIFGFKSFPEKTSLKFEPGITVVVGPNGCGKSNILDAVKWALGEQSPKSLRGTKMEDIIFNGTEHYPPLNYAEVILTFCNEDGYLPIDYKEVSVARRLYRSGESQYFINKNNVRLKDIQDLFMGTGIGESTYSFVEQGKIAIFLGYKPEEKRLIFDEASGIVKYKDRKRETMRRLKETDENLLRLDDIIAEVKRQVRYLERQVHKATKYKETEEELIAVEKKIATLQIEELQTKSDRVLEDLNLLVGQNQEKEIFLDGLRLQEESLIAGLDELRQKIETNNSEIVSVNAGLETSASHLSVYNQRIQELQERNLSLVSIEEKIRERLDSHQQRVLAERHQLDTFQERVQQLTLSIEEMKVKKETLQALIDTAKIGINEGKVKVLELESAKVNSHNSSIESQTQLATLIKRKQRLLLDKAKLEVLLSEAEEKLKSSCLEFEETKTQLEELKKHKEQLALEGKALDSQREILRTSLVDKDKELIELKSCYEFLRDLRLKYDTFSLQKKVTVIFDEDPKD